MTKFEFRLTAGVLIFSLSGCGPSMGEVLREGPCDGMAVGNDYSKYTEVIAHCSQVIEGDAVEAVNLCLFRYQLGDGQKNEDRGFAVKGKMKSRGEWVQQKNADGISFSKEMDYPGWGISPAQEDAERIVMDSGSAKGDYHYHLEFDKKQGHLLLEKARSGAWSMGRKRQVELRVVLGCQIENNHLRR